MFGKMKASSLMVCAGQFAGLVWVSYRVITFSFSPSGSVARPRCLWYSVCYNTKFTRAQGLELGEEFSV